MNYFQLFELPLSFEVDKKNLTSKYYKLSKKFHPDNFSQAVDAEQQAALKQSSIVNEGYKILKNKQARIRHILELCGISFEEGKEQMPQEFLMDMMDINEAIMDYKMEPSAEGKEKIEDQINDFERALESEAQGAMSGLDLSVAEPDAALLSAVKNYYLKSKYLKRLLDNIEDRGVEM